MSESVGKITLDLELQSDLSKQIETAASKIGEQVKASLKNIGNFDFKAIADTMSNTIKRSIEDSMKNVQSSIENALNKAIAGAVSTAKNIKIPISSDLPNNSPTPKVAAIGNIAQPRAPPISKVNAGVNFESIKAQIDNLTASLDITNEKIEQQKAKLAQLKESYNQAFDGARKNKLEEEILKTETTINRLTATSDKAGFKLADLDSQFSMLSNAAKNATAGVNAANEKLDQTAESASVIGNSAKKASTSLRLLGNSAKSTGSSFRSGYGGAKMFFDSMFKWGIIFPIIMKGITGIGTALFNAFNVNTQFARSLIQIKTNLEVAFMPIYQAILPALNTLMSALSRATAYIAAFVNALFGKTYSASFGAAKNLNSSIASMKAMEEQSKKTSKAAEGIGTSAKKASKEAKGSLAGFDEINQLQLNKDTGGGMIAPDVDLSPTSAAMSGIVIMAADFKKVLGTLFAPMKAAWAIDGAGVMAEFHNAIEGTKSTINNFFKVLAAPPVQKFLENIDRLILAIIKLGLRIYDGFILPIINWFINLLPGAASGINPILNAVVSLVNYLSGKGFPIVQAVLSGIIGLIVGIKVFQIGSKIVELLGNIKNIGVVLQGLWSVMIANPIVLIIAIIAGLIAAFIGLYNSNEQFRQKVNEVWAVISNYLNPIFKVLKGILLDLWHVVIEPLAKILKDILAEAFKVVASVAKDLWTYVLVPLGSFLADAFSKVIQSVAEIWKAWKPVIQVVIDVITWLWKNVLKPLIVFLGADFIIAFRSVFQSIGKIINDLKLVFNGLMDFITGVLTLNWRKAWTGIKEIFKGVFDTLYDVAKAPLNLIIDAINWVISGLNKIHFQTPDWIPGIGGKSFGVNISSIPKLARGGIIDQPTLAMVGEAGKEAVVPLENTEFVDTLAAAVANAVLAVMQFNKGNSSGNKDDRDIIFKLDGTTFGRLLKPYLDKEQDRMGNTLIVKTT